MRWGLNEDEPLLTLRIAIALGRLWSIRGGHEEGHAWLTEALDATPDAPADVRATGFIQLGAMIFWAGDYARAAAVFEQALELCRQLGDKQAVAHVLDHLAAPVAILGDPARARALADESLALFREIGDREGSLYPLSKVAQDEWQRGDRELGIALTREALELAREVGDSWWEAGLLADLADMAWEQGDLAGAATLARESLSLAHELGDLRTALYGLGLLAVLAAAAGQRPRAGQLWGAAEALEKAGEARFLSEDRARYERAVLALSGAELEAGLAQGRAMTFDDAFECALA
jgi:tetratricopeptide (TPR) repeat protein